MKNAKNKLFIFIILILLIANTVFSAVLWFRMDHHPPKPQPRGQYLLDEVQPDSTQETKIHALMSEHFRKMDLMKEKEHDAKAAFFSLLLTDTASVSTILSYAEHAATITLEIDTIVYNHFNAIRAICNPEQKEKLDRVIQRILIQNEDAPKIEKNKEIHQLRMNEQSENKTERREEHIDADEKMSGKDPDKHHRMPPPPDHPRGRPHERRPEDFPDGPPNMPPPGME